MVNCVWHLWNLLRHIWELRDWQAIAALATLAAVVVALLPIWREWRRSKAQARNIRIRIGSILLRFRPTLQRVEHFGFQPVTPRSGLLPQDRFSRLLLELNSLMSQSSVLEPEEIDVLGVTLLNLAAVEGLYGSPVLTSETARAVLTLITRTMNLFEKHGLLAGPVDVPWDEEDLTLPPKIGPVVKS